MQILIWRKHYFDTWKRSRSLEYLKDGFWDHRCTFIWSNGIQKTLRVDSMFGKFRWRADVFESKICLNGCDLEWFEDTSRHNFSRGFTIKLISSLDSQPFSCNFNDEIDIYLHIKMILKRSARRKGWELAFEISEPQNLDKTKISPILNSQDLNRFRCVNIIVYISTGLVQSDFSKSRRSYWRNQSNSRLKILASVKLFLPTVLRF